MIGKPSFGFTLLILAVFRSSIGAKWVVIEKYDEGDTACSGSPIRKVNPWALEDTCLSVGTAGLKDWMVQGGNGSQELYVKISCTDTIVTETVYFDQECTTLAISGNGKNSSVQHSRSCAEHSPSWSFFEKFGYATFRCGVEYPVLSWAEFKDEDCQTRAEKGVTYEADGGCYSFEGVQDWVGDGMNYSQKVTCCDGELVRKSYASSDCSGASVEKSTVVPHGCAYSSYHFAHVKVVDGICDASSFAFKPYSLSLCTLVSLVLILAPLMLP